MSCDDGGCSNSCIGGSSGCGCGGDCYTCSSSCGDGCLGGCSGCGYCDWSCYAMCQDDCSGTCTGTCNACTGACVGTCNNGCTGGQMTQIFTNLSLSRLIKASELSDLSNLVLNEITRRQGNPISTPAFVPGELALQTGLEEINANLTILGSQLQNPVAGLILRELTEQYITAAKAYYSEDIT